MRLARCYCGRTEPSAGPATQFGWQDRSTGSKYAADTCRCGYYRCAHETQPQNLDPRSVVETGKCDGFKPVGEHEYDSFYCGCGGWD
jgi:hypothetical protein